MSSSAQGAATCGTAPGGPPTGSRRCRRCRCRPRSGCCGAAASARPDGGGCAGGSARASARGRRRRGPSRSSPGISSRRSGGTQVQLAEHLAVDVAQVLVAVEPQAQAGPRANALPVGTSQKRPASIALAARMAGARRPRSNGISRNLPRRRRLADGRSGERRQLLGRGAHAGSGSGRTPRGPCGRRPGGQLLRHDREIGQLRHARGSHLDRMVCYPGRVADNPIVARERVDSVGQA